MEAQAQFDEPRKRSVALWFALAILALYGAGVNGYWRFQRDSALYMGLGRELAATGEFAFNARPHKLAPPGLPVILAGVYATCGESFLVMNLLMSAMGLGCIALAWLIFRRMELTPGQLAACLLLFGFSRTLYFYSTHVMSDVPFLMVALAGLYFGMRAREDEGHTTWAWATGAALAGVAACAIRPIGPAVPMALVAALWLQRGGWQRWKHNIAASLLIAGPALLYMVAWEWRCSQVTGGAHPPAIQAFIIERLASLPLAILKLIPKLITGTGEVVLGKDAGLAGGIPICILVAVGLVQAVRRRFWALTVYGLLCTAAPLLSTPGDRLLLAALPALLLWLVLGAEGVIYWLADVRQKMPRAKLERIARVLLVLAVLLNVGRIGKVIVLARSSYPWVVMGRDNADSYRKLTDWLRDEAPPRVLVLSPEGRLIHYFSDVWTLPLHKKKTKMLGQARMVEWMRRDFAERDAAVCYAVIENRGKKRTPTMLEGLLKDFPGAFTQVPSFTDEKLKVYEVELDSLPTPEINAEEDR